MKSLIHPSRLPTGLTISRARDEACRQDFVSFIRMSYDLLPHGEPLSMNWHIEAMAYHLEQVRLGHRMFGRIVAPTIRIVSSRASVNQGIQIGRVNAFVTVGLGIGTVPLTASREAEVELRGGADQHDNGSREQSKPPTHLAIRGLQI